MNLNWKAAGRFWRKVDMGPHPSGCWLWTAGLFSTGYGAFRLNGKIMKAHRVAYAMLVGPIPPGFVVDHVHSRGCVSRACVHPEHLEAVTQKENIRRAWAAVPPDRP